MRLRSFLAFLFITASSSYASTPMKPHKVVVDDKALSFQLPERIALDFIIGKQAAPRRPANKERLLLFKASHDFSRFGWLGAKGSLVFSAQLWRIENASLITERFSSEFLTQTVQNILKSSNEWRIGSLQSLNNVNFLCAEEGSINSVKQGKGSHTVSYWTLWDQHRILQINATIIAWESSENEWLKEAIAMRESVISSITVKASEPCVPE